MSEQSCQFPSFLYIVGINQLSVKTSVSGKIGGLFGLLAKFSNLVFVFLLPLLRMFIQNTFTSFFPVRAIRTFARLKIFRSKIYSMGYTVLTKIVNTNSYVPF